MKTKLIALVSSEKENDKINFRSKFLCTKPYKYSNKEDLRYLFWLTELQQWVIDNYGIFVEVTRGGAKNTYNCFYGDWIYSEPNKLKEYNSITSSLEDGLYVVLNKIKNITIYNQGK